MNLDKSNQNRSKRWGIILLHPKIALPILFLLILLIAPFAYRIHHLTSIPDPGDPFDVEAFIKSSEVDDTDNAYFDFQNAVSLMPSELSGYDWDKFHEELLTGSKLSAESQDALKYVKRNKPAILAWKKGTTKADYSQGDLKEANMLTVMLNVGYSIEFVCLSNSLALLAWQDGDYEKSADWYLVSFQSSRLIQQHGPPMSRLVSQSLYSASASNLIRQIHDMNIPQNVLENLLKEITGINKATPLLSDCLKVEYLTLMNSKDMLLSEEAFRNISYDLFPSQISWYFYLHAEPDLYLRLNKQWFGNVLPEVDRPRVDRSVFVGNPESPLLFNSTVKKQQNRKQMSPAEIDRAWNRPSCVMHFRSLQSINAEDRYRFYQRLLVTALKLEIYRRQHKRYPSSLKDVFKKDAVPVDPFDPKGEPIKYARDSNASCRIWSNGPDATDNGGTAIGFTNFETDYGYYLGKKIEQP